MRKLNTMGLVFFCLFSMVGVSYSACEGDLNCDGDTDGADLALLAADFGTKGCGTCDDVIGRMEELEDRIAQLEALLQHVTRNGNDIFIDGANLHIRSGSGYTNGTGDPLNPTVNGLGNLIVGYNEDRSYGNNRNGSHNIVAGKQQNYSSFGGLVVGCRNTISGPYASVSGGLGNEASDYYASVSGGTYNNASEFYASVSGGAYNNASGSYASVSGGGNNTASGDYAFVAGGGGFNAIDGNQAFGDYSAVLGGTQNFSGDPSLLDHLIGQQSTVTGGRENKTTGNSASVSGGWRNTASGPDASVTGGFQNDAQGGRASVTGGRDNLAGGSDSAVSGGYNRSVSGGQDWRAGSLFEDY